MAIDRTAQRLESHFLILSSCQLSNILPFRFHKIKGGLRIGPISVALWAPRHHYLSSLATSVTHILKFYSYLALKSTLKDPKVSKLSQTRLHSTVVSAYNFKAPTRHAGAKLHHSHDTV